MGPDSPRPTVYELPKGVKVVICRKKNNFANGGLKTLQQLTDDGCGDDNVVMIMAIV